MLPSGHTYYILTHLGARYAVHQAAGLHERLSQLGLGNEAGAILVDGLGGGGQWSRRLWQGLTPLAPYPPLGPERLSQLGSTA
eukprot:scaffold71475_cov67-Phaeocystis_antarctica.AAC.4